MCKFKCLNVCVSFLAYLARLETRSLKPKLDPLKKQSVLFTAELFLQPLNYIFNNFYIIIYFN